MKERRLVKGHCLALLVTPSSLSPCLPWGCLLHAQAGRRGQEAHFRGLSPAGISWQHMGCGGTGGESVLRCPEVSHCSPVPSAPASSDNCSAHSNGTGQACHFKQHGLFKQDNWAANKAVTQILIA